MNEAGVNQAGLQVTQLLQNLSSGDASAADRLMAAVYSELHSIAAAKMARESAGHTLQATALVNEAYLRLVGNSARLEDRAHFFGAAALAMERVLIDHARAKNAAKRGGGDRALTLADVSAVSDAPDIDLVALGDAIAELHTQHEELARIIRYRYYLGLSLEEIAELLPMPLRTLKRRWAFARAWLQDRLDGAGG